MVTPSDSAAGRVLRLVLALHAASGCALFSTSREFATTAAPEAGGAPRRAPPRPAPSAVPPAPTEPAPRTEVTTARGFHLRRTMVVALSPVATGRRDDAFELLERLLGRRSVRVLDLSRATELHARVDAPTRDHATHLEGPFEGALWAARWAGATHLLVGETSAHTGAPASDPLAVGRYRLLALPGAEVVWAARLERRGATEGHAVARTLDAVVDALHGTLRDEPDPNTTTAPAPPAPPTHRHHRSRRRPR